MNLPLTTETRPAQAAHPPVAADTRVALDTLALRAAAGRAVGALKSLANEDRLLLLCQLTQGEMHVSELEQRLGIRQPTLSQQLAVLRQEGLVLTRREGKRVHYRAAEGPTLDILQLLYRLYCPPEPGGGAGPGGPNLEGEA